MELRQEIIQAAMQEFRYSGLHFTMQDIAARLHISKKTIYTVYASKEELLQGILEAGFTEIHRRKQALLDSELPTVEKLRRVIIAMPDEYRALDFRRLQEIGIRFPAVSEALKRHLENDWDPTLQLINQGIQEGCIRPVSVPILRMMITAGIEAFLSTGTLTQ